MYNVTVNNKTGFKIISSFDKNEIIIEDKKFHIEVIKDSLDLIRLVFDGKTFEAQILKLNFEEKAVLLKINQNKYEVRLKDRFDILLEKLGMDSNISKKQNNIKAPMPGLVLKLLVEEGTPVKKGDPLIILEAMKMENILKSPSDVIVKRIAVSKGNSVEKNQLLIEFS
jgi:biotin carboxyl carrier protein